MWQIKRLQTTQPTRGWMGGSVAPAMGSRGRGLREGEAGQSLIIIAFAIIGLVAIIGLGVDLGVVYVERVRLGRAMDAAALAGAQELPAEEAAHQRALEYLDGNGYDHSVACVETHGSDLSGGPGSCGGSSSETNIIIDTISYRNDGELNTADRINVRGSREVPLTFLRVVGFDTVPIAAGATAENIDDLDIAIVYDRTGSMKEDTRCYGCWEPIAGQDYRLGTTYPLPLNADPDTGIPLHCEPTEPLEFEGHRYLSIEAEHYSRYAVEADYHFDHTEYPKIWWAMQRAPNMYASGPDARGSYMKVGPHGEFPMYFATLADIQHPPAFFTTPRLDYDFTVPQDGTYYVWIRAQGGTNGWDASVRRIIHLGLNGTPLATGSTPNYSPYNAAGSRTAWRWTRVLTLPGLDGPSTVYTLNLWAAAGGFSVDKIVITNDTETDYDDTPMTWSYNGISDGGPHETHGRNGWACMVDQDPRFVPVDPATGELDDLYDDFQPIRAAKEAAKRFVRRLNPELDQIAYVWYNDRASIREELYCVKHYGSCTDFENVVAAIESTFPEGGTNIADGIWDGLRVLTTGEEPPLRLDGEGFPSKSPGLEHYGRASAAHILVLMTDGQANVYPTLPTNYGNCYSDNLWPDVPGETTAQNRARECTVWFGNQARDQGVVVYTIGLGAQVDNELLAYVADITGGAYYHAPSAAELDAIFDSLYERIFLRLVD